MTKRVLLVCVALLIATAGFAAQMQFLSKVYTIDRKYRSMEGPASIQKIYLGKPGTAELLWITGIRTEMVGEDGTTPQLPELMCHVNVDLDGNLHQVLFDLPRPTAARLMTLSQGMLWAKLPAGFGFPIVSSEPLQLFTQVLNHNIEHPNNLKVRHRVTFEYVRDADLKEPMKPLFNLGASGTVQLTDNPLALATMGGAPPTSAATTGEVAGAPHTGSCLVGMRAPQANAGAADYIDPSGRHMTGHWIVPPGRQVNTSDITWFMRLPFDTKLHYAAVHLHPFAESLSIQDVTTGETVLQSKATNPKKGVGLTHVETASSVDGIPFYKDHTYELISTYNNTSGANADSMASVFLGLDDLQFVRPSPTELARRSTVLFDSDEIVIRTTAGNVTAVFARDAAPNIAIQVVRLALAGAFNARPIVNAGPEIRISVQATQIVRNFLLPSSDDHGITLEAGTIAYCAPTLEMNDVTLQILGATPPKSDARCVGFARLTGGREVLQAIHEAPVGLSAFVSGIDAVRSGSGSASH